MNLKSLYAVALMGAFVFNSCDKGGEQIKNESDKLSYSIGVVVGNDLKDNLGKSGFDSINGEVLAAAIKDVFSSGELKIAKDSAQQFLEAYSNKLQEQKSQKAVEEGKSFLQQNKAKQGVIELPSGLQYEVIKEGSGPKPTLTDNVSVHYTGKLLNGKVFDSSVERNEPASFQVSGVIQGWTEALQLMPVGSKWNLYIPSDLAYGPRGAGRDIPPHSTLIFEVELLSINANQAH